VEDEGLGNVIGSATGTFDSKIAGETVGTCIVLTGLDVTVVVSNVGGVIGMVEAGAAGNGSGAPDERAT
jgi:hypothetical protein